MKPLYTDSNNNFHVIQADDRLLLVDFRADPDGFLNGYPTVESAEPIRQRMMELRAAILGLMAALEKVPPRAEPEKVRELRENYWKVKETWHDVAGYIRAYSAVIAMRSGKAPANEILQEIVKESAEYQHYSRIQTQLHKKTARYKAKQRAYSQRTKEAANARRRKRREKPGVLEKEAAQAQARYAVKAALKGGTE